MTALTSLARRDGSAAAVDSLSARGRWWRPASRPPCSVSAPSCGRWSSTTLSGGGKYVRAGLVVLSAAAAGADERSASSARVAIELVHNFSLIHDDIIDGDLERRHRPTRVGRATASVHAIIAGDALADARPPVLLDDADARARAGGRAAWPTPPRR